MSSDWIYAIATGLAVIAAGSVLVLVRARRAGLALHREIEALHQEVAVIRPSVELGREHHNLWSDRIHHEIAQLRNEVQDSARQIGHIGTQVGRVGAQVTQVGTEVAQTQDRLRDTSVRLGGAVQSLNAQVSGLTAVVEAQMSVRRPLQAFSVDPRVLESTSEEELLHTAESLAILRPLVPYPNWQWDADADHPDLSYRLRLWLWQYFHDQKGEAPIVARWHADTRLRLFLGNDISRQIFVAGCIEPNEFAFLDRILRPGMTFLDAGANDGIYAVFAAKRVGPEGVVWAFEPSRRELERLQFNLDLNGLSARVFPVALAEANGQAELTVSESEHSGHNTLGALAYQNVRIERKELVEVRRLDDLVEDAPPGQIDVMKLDVEGAELRLLRGAVGAVERYRPYILFEASEQSLRHQGSNRDELVEFLRSQKYRIYAYDRVTGLPVPSASGLYSDNMIGVPEENPLPDTARWTWPVRI
jgi:FkbM family methyltransferase